MIMKNEKNAGHADISPDAPGRELTEISQEELAEIAKKDPYPGKHRPPFNKLADRELLLAIASGSQENSSAGSGTDEDL